MGRKKDQASQNQKADNENKESSIRVAEILQKDGYYQVTFSEEVEGEAPQWLKGTFWTYDKVMRDVKTFFSEGDNKTMDYTDIMFDLEFLSLRTSPIILSIGAVAFKMNVPVNSVLSAQFYLELELQDQIDRGRALDESTLRWWAGQEHSARKVLIEPATEARYRMPHVLNELSGWYTRMGGDKSVKRIWSHGASCDMAILHSLFFDYKLACPWHYRVVRDTRTLFDVYYESNIGTKKEVDKYLKPAGEAAHNALIDAKNQAEAVRFVWSKLNLNT